MFGLAFSLVLRSPQLNGICPQSEFWASHLLDLIHFEMETRKELAQTVAQRTRSSDQQRLGNDWTTTSVCHLPLPQTCWMNQEELRSHLALLSRVLLQALPHYGLCSAAALGKC